MIPSRHPTRGNSRVFLSVAEELERVPPRSGQVYGESPAWIRRVLQAYSASEEQRWRALLRQAARGSRADIPLGIPRSQAMLQRPGSQLPSMDAETIAQGAGEIYQTVTSETESGMFDDIFGGIGDVAGNIIEGINTVVEGVGSVVTDVAAAAGQIGQLGGAFEEAIGSIRTTAAGIPALIRGTPPVIYRGGGRNRRSIYR